MGWARWILGCSVWAGMLAAGVYGAVGARGASPASSPASLMVSLKLDGRAVEGTPVQWSETRVSLLGRDGRLWQFAPDQAKDFQKTADRFQAYSPSEFRAALLRELGRDYEVSGTGHFLVAHTKGEPDKWPARFEQLYRDFVHYFQIRGFSLAEPQFPLVGIVCRNREEFVKHAKAQGVTAGFGLSGFYDVLSNRILLFDNGGPDNGKGWARTASVIIHEATHQTAFNTGIHNRLCPAPRWQAEGLATLFEAPGIYDSRTNADPASRINRERLNDFRQRVLPKHRPELLAEMIASDRLFQTDAMAAYAEAWALTYYLVESEPKKYSRYLARTAARSSETQPTAAERTADFVAVYGDNWKMLESQFLRFMGGVK